MPDRRTFLGLLGAGTALPLLPELAHAADSPALRTDDWDMSWVDRVNGLHRTVLAAPELSGGLPLLRACLLAKQYDEVYQGGGNMSTVLVLRHTAFAFAMGDETWDRFDNAKDTGLELFAGAPAAPGNPVASSAT